MTLHITITDDDEPVKVPDCHDLLRLNDALHVVAAALREQAQTNGLPGAWGAVRALESVTYYMHGAAGWLALDEGIIGLSEPEPSNG